MKMKSILGAMAAMLGASASSSNATIKAGRSVGKSITEPYAPSSESHLYPAHQPSYYTTTGTRKAMRAAKKRRGIKAKQPK